VVLWTTKLYRRHHYGGFRDGQETRKARLASVFRHLSKVLVGCQAEIDVTSLALVDQVQAKWLPLFGIVYDPKDDLVEVALEGLDHLIRKPRDISIEEGNGLLARVEIIDADGIRQNVKLKEALMLPPPQS
jgi:hypothetical protein